MFPIKSWRKQDARYSLTGSREINTGNVFYPPISYDPKSQSTNFKPERLPAEAKLVTWSTVHAAPKGFEQQVPYTIAILEFSNGQRFTSQLVDTPDHLLQHGQTFVPTFRKLYQGDDHEILHYGLKWQAVCPSDLIS